MTQSSAAVSRIETPGRVLLEDVSALSRPQGRDLFARTASYLEWQDRRCRAGLCPYPNSAAHTNGCGTGHSAPRGGDKPPLDFASRDPLLLANDPALRRAAAFGFELAGSSQAIPELEAALGEWLEFEHVAVFDSGLDARFHVVDALVGRGDSVVLDAEVDPTFEQAAREATPDVFTHSHLDLEELRAQLCEIRARHATRGILVVTQSLFPLESDAPDLSAIQLLCREYEARLLVDVSHDLGVLAEDGSGQLGLQGLRGRVDMLVGSLSAGLVSSIGFLATGSREAAEFVKFHSGTQVLTRQPSALQCAVATEAVRMARSARCRQAREEIGRTALALRHGLEERRVPCLGQASPYVDVHLGWEGAARLVSSLLREYGLHADLIEHPIVPVGAARLCLQIPANGVGVRTEEAANIIADSIQQAWQIVARP